MSTSKRVRLSDIAERLGLSTVSISKALRGHSDISDETRAQVQKTAKEMGYVPNLLARSLSSKQSKTLGVVMPKIAHSFFATVLDGIHEQAAAQGYEIVLTVSREKAKLERKHLETLLSMRVDGILVSASQQAPDRDIYERVRDMGVPLVFFDRRAQGLSKDLGFSSVTVDDRGGAREAVAHVLDQGYRRIAHVAGYEHVSIGRDRRTGYEEALQAHGLSPTPSWIVEGGFSEPYGYRGFKKVLKQAQGKAPEAVFAVTFPVGLGVLDALQEVAPDLPGRVQIIAFGNHALNRYLGRPFVCVHQPARELGQRATALLLEEILETDSNGAKKSQQVVLPTRLIPSEKTQKPPYLKKRAERPISR